jgi:hypothetical protein
LKAEKIKVFGDSEIIIWQVTNTIHCLSIHLKHYQLEVLELIKSFTAFNISFVPRSLKCDVDLLANVASRLIPSYRLMPDTFFLKLLYRPWILDNITNWRVFDDDQQLINFLHLKDTFKDSIINEGQHDQIVNPNTIYRAQSNNLFGSTNYIPINVVRLEKIYDI